MNPQTQNPRLGQTLIEFNLIVLFVVIPLCSGGVFWFKAEWNRSICAYQAFFNGRKQMIATNQQINKPVQCENILEVITLKPLEDLDQDKGSLDFTDAINEVSRLWELVSH